ncbi:MAG: glycosyltransferase [Anaerolineae bacterium]|nr:glycosyltransferase [Anaerolineae bacterium]
MSLIAAIHVVLLLALALYSVHHLTLIVLCLAKRRADANVLPSPAEAALPTVTVQIPVYNERFVAERVIEAAAAQDYPADKLQVQVLDDSDDDTVAVIDRAVARLKQEGKSVSVIRREQRAGYKAGALAAGLAQTHSELIAIFDADFVPARDFLRRVIVERAAFADPAVGFVQTRWTFANREDNALTRAQAVALDVHFLVEQPARAAADLMLNFNGSAGIWRRACILDAGGWQADTLTEDLDLSYRAQLRGWRAVYLPDVCAQSDLPADMSSYKRQQARWARGSIQVARKVLPALLSSRRSLLARLAGWFHLTGYAVHALILLLALTTPALALESTALGSASLPGWLGAVGLICAAPLVSMALAQRMQQRGLGDTLRGMLDAVLVGVGVAFSNTRAMAQALVTPQVGTFDRTPKGDPAQGSAYRALPDWTMWAELGLSAIASAALLLTVLEGAWAFVPTLALYSLGFGRVWLDQVRSRSAARVPAAMRHALQLDKGYPSGR